MLKYSYIFKSVLYNIYHISSYIVVYRLYKYFPIYIMMIFLILLSPEIEDTINSHSSFFSSSSFKSIIGVSKYAIVVIYYMVLAYLSILIFLLLLYLLFYQYVLLNLSSSKSSNILPHRTFSISPFLFLTSITVHWLPL